MSAIALDRARLLGFDRADAAPRPKAGPAEPDPKTPAPKVDVAPEPDPKTPTPKVGGEPPEPDPKAPA